MWTRLRRARARIGPTCGGIGVRKPATGPNRASSWKSPASSSKRLDEAVDEPVEFGIALAHGVDLPNRVDHRRVMLAAEHLSDLRQRRVGQRLGEVHRDLAWLGHGLGVVLGL